MEKQALQEIKSPYVIELLDVKSVISGGRRYDGLLFKYVEGEDLAGIFLRKKNSKKPFTEKEVRKLLEDITSAIVEMSDRGWVHQDIKQKNIRFDKANGRKWIYKLLPHTTINKVDSFRGIMSSAYKFN